MMLDFAYVRTSEEYLYLLWQRIRLIRPLSWAPTP